MTPRLALLRAMKTNVAAWKFKVGLELGLERGTWTGAWIGTWKSDWNSELGT